MYNLFYYSSVAVQGCNRGEVIRFEKQGKEVRRILLNWLQPSPLFQNWPPFGDPGTHEDLFGIWDKSNLQWMSPVRKCGWLDMENTKLVSGEIQHSSSKTRKCERLGLTNAKGPNQEIQISAGTNPISSKANQSKLCEGSRSVICHMLHVTCIYWIITLTEKMMGHNHFDDQFMSKLSITSTSWPNC